MSEEAEADRADHELSIVVPVYQGETHLAALVAEIEPYIKVSSSPAGHAYRVAEVLLVHDHGPDGSPAVMRELAERYAFVKTIWLSRNFGQHAATLAGMASSGGHWIATMDEDGQHDPSYLGAMLDVALREQAAVVYADPTNRPPHSAFRNLTSTWAKRIVNLVGDDVDAAKFHSFRLVLGEVGRSMAAYAGAGVYLDIALSWVAPKAAQAPVELRSEGTRASGYSTRRLLSHFWKMVLSGGTRGLRVVAGLGIAFGVLGFVIAGFLVVNQLTNPVVVQGWTSLVVVVLVCTGAILVALSVIAEYVGVAVNMAMGKPPYLITSDPAEGPLGRR